VVPKPEGSSPHSQQPANDPYPEPGDHPGPRLCNIFVTGSTIPTGNFITLQPINNKKLYTKNSLLLFRCKI
jgi:hypothetical protein